jgi:hypothetical protein
MAIEATTRDGECPVYARGLAADRPDPNDGTLPEGFVYAARDGGAGARVFVKTRKADNTTFEWVALA